MDQTILPLTIEATWPPLNSRPWKGELRLLERDLFRSNTQGRSVSKIVTSASPPIVSDPCQDSGCGPGLR